MEISQCSPDLVGSLSPSRITDYYISTKPRRGPSRLEKTKGHPVSKSSIYLTPESSPGNDSNGDPDQDSFCNKDCPKVEITDNVSSCKSHVDSHISESTTDTSHDLTNTSQNSCSSNTELVMPCKDNEIGTENTKEILASPPKIHSKLAKSSSAKEMNETTMTAHSEADITSPSVPRPKIRKGVKSKSNTDSLAANALCDQTRPKPGRRKKREPEPIQKNVITDFFPVRRSGRLTKSEIEKEKQHQLEQQILSKCEDGLQIKEFDNKGRGVVAVKDFLKGDFVVEYDGELISVIAAKQREEDYAANPQIGCYMYYFNAGTKQYCVDATAESGRLGRLINHSREGNCCTRAVMLKDKPHLILVASRNIKSGEELSYDYGDRSKAALEAHPWLKS